MLSDSTPSAVAVWMDRLSDRIGALVPGCSRLSTRHPVKVSLVMTLLALFAAWSSTVVIAIGELWLGPSWGDSLCWYGLPGAALGCMVLMPLCLWLKRGFMRPFLVVVLSIIANVIQIYLLSYHPPDLGGLNFLWTGLAAGAAYSAAGLIAVHGRRWWLMFPASCVGILPHGVLVFNDELMSGRWLLPDQFVFYTFIGNFFATIFTSIGVAFGSVLWDWTPPAKFEPVEAQQTSASP